MILVALAAGLPAWPYSAAGPAGGAGVLIVIVGILLLPGVFQHRHSRARCGMP